jgi:hypothetical protein
MDAQINKFCFACGNPAEFQCEDCEEWFCDNCLQTMDGLHMLEKCMCKSCYEVMLDARAYYYQQEEEREKRFKVKKQLITCLEVLKVKSICQVVFNLFKLTIIRAYIQHDTMIIHTYNRLSAVLIL